MISIGFGLERIAGLALRWPKISGVLFVALLGLAGYGASFLEVDKNMRGVFASDTERYQTYVEVTEAFSDPENELLILVEGESLAEPDVFTRLQDLQFELLFVDGVDSVFSLFSLREAPISPSNAPLIVADPSAGLTEELADKIRRHPINGAKLLSIDSDAMIYSITPSTPKAPLEVAREVQLRLEETAASVLADTDLAVTVSGFPIVRADISDILRRDQIVLNGVGAAIGFVLSLLVFRSIVAAALTSIPAMLGGFTVVGFMGLLGVPITVMSNVVPAVVMILGYADGMHLTFTFRKGRDEGLSVFDAETKSQREVAGACMLAAVTTSVAFISLTISEITIVRDFGATGAVATVFGTLVILVAHILIALTLGRFWKSSADSAQTFLGWLAKPSFAIGDIAVRYARPLSVLAVLTLVAMAFMHFSLPPQNSVREHLPGDNTANAALGRIDQSFGGVFPIQIVLPDDGIAPLSVDGLARLEKVHDAVVAIDDVATPLSLWSVVQWLGGAADQATVDRLELLLGQLSEEEQKRLVRDDGRTLLTVSTQEVSTEQTKETYGKVYAAASGAGGDEIVVTGVTVLTALEANRTIQNLNMSLALSVVANLAVIAIAFRSIPIGLVAFIPNIMPILATGAILFLSGSGMQLTSVIALTVAFGIAVDDTVHFLNRYYVLGHKNLTLDHRLVETAGHVGPVLFGTTIIIIAGLASTLTSGMPTIALFGQIAATALAIALFCDLLYLPAIMKVFGRRWFDTSGSYKGGESHTVTT